MSWASLFVVLNQNSEFCSDISSQVLSYLDLVIEIIFHLSYVRDYPGF